MKILVLSSGGVDSTTCLALAVKEQGAENVVSLSLFYGQKHSRELAAARAVADYYGVEHIELDLTAAIPHESYAQQLAGREGQPVSTYVPFRNGLFIAAAASVALSKGCGLLYYGAHRDDAAGNAYPDCSEAFNQAMGEAVRLGSGDKLNLAAPFVDSNKAGVVKCGLELKVPYELTWSCYEGKATPCGSCGTG